MGVVRLFVTTVLAVACVYAAYMSWAYFYNRELFEETTPVKRRPGPRPRRSSKAPPVEEEYTEVPVGGEDEPEAAPATGPPASADSAAPPGSTPTSPSVPAVAPSKAPAAPAAPPAPAVPAAPAAPTAPKELELELASPEGFEETPASGSWMAWEEAGGAKSWRHARRWSSGWASLLDTTAAKALPPSSPRQKGRVEAFEAFSELPGPAPSTGGTLDRGDVLARLTTLTNEVSSFKRYVEML